MTMYGYARVSSKDQNLNRQLDALSAVGVSEESVFVDHLSGRNFDRPGYRSLVERLQPGDVLVVKSTTALAATTMRYSASGDCSPSKGASTSWCWICRCSTRARRPVTG